jgi:predicted dehydrogenase
MNVAMVGTGNVFPVHVRGVAGMTRARARIAGVYDIDGGKALQAARAHGIVHTYPSYDAVLEDPGVHMVSILTPPGSHRDLSIRAMRAGKHVFCEKPMAPTVEDCDAMLGEARRTGARLFIGHNRVHTAAARKAGELIRDGVIGDVFAVLTRGIEGWELLGRMPSLKTDPADVVNTQLIHPLYQIPYLIGQPIESVFAKISRREGSELNGETGTVMATITYGGGAHHQAFGTFERPYGASEHEVHIIGSDAELKLVREGMPGHGRHENLCFLPKGAGEPRLVPLENRGVQGPEFAAQYDDLATALWTGGRTTITPEGARDSVAVAGMVVESARRGREVNCHDALQRLRERREQSAGLAI